MRLKEWKIIYGMRDYIVLYPNYTQIWIFEKG